MAELVNLSIPETQQSNNRDPRHCEGLETQEEKIILHSGTRSPLRKQPARGGHDSAMAACMWTCSTSPRLLSPRNSRDRQRGQGKFPWRAFRIRQKLKPPSPRVSGIGFQLNVLPCWSQHGSIRTASQSVITRIKTSDDRPQGKSLGVAVPC